MKHIGIGCAVLLFAALLGGPLLAPVWRNEARLWRLAALQNAFAAGNRVAVRTVLDLAQAPQGLDQVAARVGVEMLLADEQPREAARLNRVLIEQCNPNRLASDQPLGQLQLRVLEANRQFAAAVAWLENHAPPDQPPSESDLNRLAYTRGLAGRDLPLALDEIQVAITGSERQALLGTPVRLETVAVVAAAFLARDPAEQEELRDWLTTEIDVRELDAAEGAGGGASRPPGSSLELALLYTTRAKLCERLGDSAQSQLDRARVRAAGQDPAALLRRIPGDEVLMVLAQFAAALLDTRGFILYRLDQTAPAAAPESLADFLRFGAPRAAVRSLPDFDVAILAAQTFYRHLGEYPTLNASPFVTAATFAQESGQARETLATLYAHRAAARDAAGDQAGAARDRRQITELGLDPEKQYF